jgi:hypothetical protein
VEVAQVRISSAAWDVWQMRALQVQVQVLDLALAEELCVFEMVALADLTKQPKGPQQQKYPKTTLSWLLWRTNE